MMLEEAINAQALSIKQRLCRSEKRDRRSLPAELAGAPLRAMAFDFILLE
jgi:hypothetical protein